MRGSAKTQNLVWLRFWAPSFTLVSRPYSLGVVFPGSQLDAHVLSEACSPGLGSRSPALLMPGVLSQPHLCGACSAPGACGPAPAKNLRGNPWRAQGPLTLRRSLIWYLALQIPAVSLTLTPIWTSFLRINYCSSPGFPSLHCRLGHPSRRKPGLNMGFILRVPFLKDHTPLHSVVPYLN